MKHKVVEILKERGIDFKNQPIEQLYYVGMENVKSEIEFYFDKPFTCESVIKELFIIGIKKYLAKQTTNKTTL